MAGANPIPEDIVSLYDRVASRYGEVGPPVFAHFGRRLVELADIGHGARVLDVAAGRGAVLLPAARQVGPHGQVIGIDLSPVMVDETTAAIHRAGVPNATMLCMDAEHLAFRDASFDAVLCAFAIFFLDIESALREFHRVLRPGGRLTLTTAGGGDERWRWYNDLLVAYHRAHGIPLSPPSRGRQWTADDLVEMLDNAGFAVLKDVIEEYDAVYADAEEWWAAKWSHGARYPLERMSPAVLSQFREEAMAQLALLKQPDGFHERWRIRCTVAIKAVQETFPVGVNGE